MNRTATEDPFEDRPGRVREFYVVRWTRFGYLMHYEAYAARTHVSLDTARRMTWLRERLEKAGWTLVPEPDDVPEDLAPSRHTVRRTS